MLPADIAVASVPFALAALVVVAPRGSPARRLLELSGLPPATSLVEAGGASSA